MRFTTTCFVIAAFLTLCNGHSKESVESKVTLMTWNILAPIFVNETAHRLFGVVDLNLLDANIRLKLVIQEVLEKKPDVLFFQEVQANNFDMICDLLASVYKAVDFARFTNFYGRDEFLPEGVEYVENGVATFYNKRKFCLDSNTSFPIGDAGNIALASVLRPRVSRFCLSGKGQPIVAVNCHLESGATLQDGLDRLIQGTEVMNQAERIASDLIARSPSNKPTVIIAGDINTAPPFADFTNFEQRGYKNAQNELGKPKNTIYFEKPVLLPFGAGFVEGAAIDRVFLRAKDIESGLIRFLSLDIPDVKSEKLSEESYIERVIKILAYEVRLKGNWKATDTIRYLLESESFSSLFKTVKDGKEFTAKINRFFRLGSDHAPVLVEFAIDSKW